MCLEAKKKMFVVVLLVFYLRVICGTDFSLTIEEKSPIDRPILQFAHPYELLSNFQSNFHLTNEKRQLMLTKSIDRDSWCIQNICSCDRCSFELEVFSTEEKRISTINITVIDINDHICQFLDIQENISLSESIQIGHRFPIARAIDLDSGPNGQLEFRLLNHEDYFQLNIVNLSFNEFAIYGVVRRSLDRETIENFELIIEGRDHGIPFVKTNRTKVNISILDENDNAPKFNQTEYSIQSLPEDTPIGTELLTIFASDADKGPNGLIHYSMSSSSSPFAINSTSGVVYLRSGLDYETTRSYRFLIRASDSGLPQSLFTDTWLSISIKDVNDSPVQIQFIPNQRFQWENQTIFIYENTAIENLTLGSIRLFDPDSIPTKLSVSLVLLDSIVQQNYQLIPSNQLNNFLLLVTDGIFDREMQREIHLRFVASDGLFTSIYEMKIHLIDLNDNPSEFSSNPTKFSVEELANYRMTQNPIVTDRLTVGFLNAIDRDEGENAVSHYELETNPWLKIDSITGRLFLIQPLDREEISLIRLKGKATNVVEPKWITEVQIEIEVLDVNDNIPRCFSPIFRLNLPENVSIDRPLLKINATDPDQGLNGTIHYSMRSNNSWPFEMNKTSGEISSKKSFDFESNWKIFRIEIDLEDRGFPIQNQNKNACELEIFIEDVNDNRPELVDSRQSQIFIDLQKLFSNDIFQFNVKDDDSGDNGKIRFSLLTENDEPSPLFFVSSNGTFQIKDKLKEIGLFYLKLVLEDFGHPTQQTIIPLTVAVGDSSQSSSSTFDQILLKYSRAKNIGFIFASTILSVTLFFSLCLCLSCFFLRRHRKRHQTALATRNKLLCSSSQQLTSSGSTTTTNTNSSTSIEHQIHSTNHNKSFIQFKPNYWEEKFSDHRLSQSYTVDTSSPESRTYKILHVPQDNEHYLRYFHQEKVDNQSSDHGYHGSYETASSSSPSQISITRSYVNQTLPDFVTKCKTLSEGFLVEMNVDGSDEDAR